MTDIDVNEKSVKKARGSGGSSAGADGKIRLNVYIARSGLCSRREADRLIESGAVTVNGSAAKPGDKVSEDGRDRVLVHGNGIRPEQRKTIVAYYKPVGVTCTESDPHAERTLADAFRYPIHLTYAGRLDRDSEGLLLMTNDGELIDAMMRGRNGHEKEYIVRLTKKICDADLNRMRKGIYLKELGVSTKPCEVTRLGDRTFSIVLTQGLNRQIRRMAAACNNEVKRLKRIRVLNIRLEAMKPGQIRELTAEERRELYREAGMPADGKQ